VTADREEYADGSSKELIVASVMGVPGSKVREVYPQRFAVEALAEIAPPGLEGFHPFVRAWLIVELAPLDAFSGVMGLQESCC
jgi:hypothetical protein